MKKKKAQCDNNSDLAQAGLVEGTESDSSCDVLFSVVEPWKMDSRASFHI